MKNNDHIRNELIKMIKNHSTRFAINCVGGYDNFKRALNIESPDDFLNLFNDLSYVKIEDRLVFYFEGTNNFIMIYNLTNKELRVGSIDFPLLWLFKISFSDSASIIKSWFNLNFDMPVDNAYHIHDRDNL